MSHYVTKPTQRSRKYYIFSTITMSAISPLMYRAEMESYLAENGYDSYLDPTPWTKQNPNWYDRDTDLGRRIAENTDAMTYWNGSFWYVTEEDGYFV